MTALISAFAAVGVLTGLVTAALAGALGLLTLTRRPARRPAPVRRERPVVRPQPRALPAGRPAEAAVAVREQDCPKCGDVMEVTQAEERLEGECSGCGLVLTAEQRGAA